MFSLTENFTPLQLLWFYSFVPILVTLVTALIVVWIKKEWFRKLRFLKTALLVLSVSIIGYTLLHEVEKHGSEISTLCWVIIAMVGFLTFYFMGRHTHHHSHEIESLDNAGLAMFLLGVAVHSLGDGAVIGGAFLVMPLLGISTAVGVIAHEIPKTIAIVVFLESLGYRKFKTVVCAILPQLALPIAAFAVYLFGKPVQMESDVFHVSLLVFLFSTILAVLWMDVRYHKKHDHSKVKNHAH